MSIDTTSLTELRQVAEKQLAKQASDAFPNETDTKRLLHELQVHRIELEMQNHALLEAQAEIARSLEQFMALYELAPIAYFTLDREGRIVKANALGRKLFGNPLLLPKGCRFAGVLETESLYLFRAFLDRIFAQEKLDTCDLTMAGFGDTQETHVHLEGVANDANQECHLVVTDVTKQKILEQRLALLEKSTLPSWLP